MKRFAMTAAAIVLVVLQMIGGRATSRRISAAAALINDGVLRLVVIGDSVARGAGDESHRGIGGNIPAFVANDRHLEITNLAIDGARTCAVQRVLRTSAAQQAIRAADVLIVSIGGNDLYGDSVARLLSTFTPSLSEHRVLARVKAIVVRAHAINPAARVMLLGLYDPYRTTSVGAFLDQQVNLWDAALIREFAADRSVTVIRVADILRDASRLSPLDHFHPGAAGYSLIAARIAGCL